MNEFKQVHQQTSKKEAAAVLHEFYAKWNKAYSHVIKGLKEIEPDLLVFYNYPKQIRASIYSTNMIESFNNRLKRKTKPKTEFPTEQSLDPPPMPAATGMFFLIMISTPWSTW